MSVASRNPDFPLYTAEFSRMREELEWRQMMGLSATFNLLLAMRERDGRASVVLTWPCPTCRGRWTMNGAHLTGRCDQCGTPRPMEEEAR